MVPFQYEHSRGGCISLRPYLYHLSSMMAAIVAIGAASYVTELGRGLRMALGSMVALLVFSVLLLPNSIYALPGSKAEAGEGEDVEGGETEGGSSDGDGAEEDRKGLLTGLMQPATEGERGKEEEGTSTPASNSTFVSFYGRHVPLSEVVKTWRAYCLMAVFCTVAGSGLLVINNIQAVAHAVGAEPSTFFVSLVSLANSLGRVGLGVLADALAGKVARLQLLALTCLSMACTLMVLSLGEPALLFLSLLLVGAAFGAAFGNVAAIAADLWGTQYIGELGKRG
ncbi:hypothetical protein B484DRAFT_184302 [Ochromonadaceae sp. CCMP2298]|nr:hypothetical protein B484DRAFT_184302 [Ochromonadaceae sp. CCMP2298]